MAKRVQTLSPSLLQEIRALVEERQNKRPLGQPPMEDPGDLHQASDIFVVQAPEDGIPATDDDGNVGHADCEVQFLFDDETTAELEPTGQVLRIYNLSDTDVEADDYAIVVKTKFGQWFVIGSFGGGSASTPLSCVLTKLKGTDCLQATVTPGGVSVLMEPSGGGHWTSTTDLNYGYGTGEVEFWFDGGTLHLSLSGMEMMYCGNSCWSGGELTGHLTNSGTGIPECGGVSFKVCLECHTCTLPPVSVACCTGPMAQVLNAQIALHGGGGVGSCACLAPPLNLTLTWSPGTGDWRYSGDICGTDSVFRFYCDPGIMKIEGVSGCTFPPVNPYNGPDADCNPVLFQYEIPIADFSCCTPTIIGVQVTITE